MSENFKTCLFGGFDKEDVVQFIEKLSQEHQAEIEKLAQERDDLREKWESAKSKLSCAAEKIEELRDLSEQHENDSNLLEELRSRLEQANDRIAALSAENDALRGPAKEYESIKDHIAQIEINAHRRTEEFRAEAVAKLKESIARQREWCSTQRDRCEQMSDDLLQQFRLAENELEKRDLSGFVHMAEELDAIEDSLDRE